MRSPQGGGAGARDPRSFGTLETAQAPMPVS
jgi:hypothetical protein